MLPLLLKLIHLRRAFFRYLPSSDGQMCWHDPWSRFLATLFIRAPSECYDCFSCRRTRIRFLVYPMPVSAIFFSLIPKQLPNPRRQEDGRKNSLYCSPQMQKLLPQSGNTASVHYDFPNADKMFQYLNNVTREIGYRPLPELRIFWDLKLFLPSSHSLTLWKHHRISRGPIINH